MKKVLAIILLLSFVFMMGVIPSNAAFGRSYTALKATPVIDGEIDDVWEHVEWTVVDKPHNGEDYTFPEKLRMKILWDDTYAYFLAEVTDADANYENDLVEVYFDEGNEKATAYDANDHQTRFKKDGAVHEAGTQPRFDSVAVGKDFAGGWILEGQIEWILPHKEGDKLGLEFMFNIGDSTADFTHALRWNVDTNGGDTAPYQSTDAFGELTLGAPVPEPIIEEVVEEVTPVAEVSENPPSIVLVAAQTSDSILLIGFIFVTAIISTIILKKKKI